MLPRSAKRERNSGQCRGVDEEEAERLRSLKRERLNAEQAENELANHDAGQRRALLSGYNEILNLISEKRNELLRPESEKFGVIIRRVEKLHELVEEDPALTQLRCLELSISLCKNETMTGDDTTLSLNSDLHVTWKASYSPPLEYTRKQIEEVRIEWAKYVMKYHAK